MNVHYLARTTNPIHGQPRGKTACGKTVKPNHVVTSERGDASCAKCLRAMGA